MFSFWALFVAVVIAALLPGLALHFALCLRCHGGYY